MSLRQYLILMSLTTAVAYLIVLAIIFYFDPYAAGGLIIGFFYASLFLALIGTFSVMGFLLRHFFGDDGVIFRQVITAFRQSVWLSLLIVVSIFLKQRGQFSSVAVIALIAALAALELFFITRRSKKVIV